jgi:hypothetical protein
MMGDIALVGVGRYDVVTCRVTLVVAHQLVDRPLQRGREEQGLTRGARPVDQPSHDGEEAHVGHPVGLVDHHHVDVGERGRAALDQVGEPPRAGDEHVDPVAQGRHLLAVPDAAVHRGHPGADGRGQGSHDLLDLCGELTGGDEDEGGRLPAALAPCGRRRRQPGQDRQREGERLAGTGGSLPADVAPGQAVGQGGGLDGERGDDPPALERGGQHGRDAEVREADRRHGR